MQIQIPTSLTKLANLFTVDLYVVGGYLRNQLMGLENEDIDICSSLTIKEVELLLRGTEFAFKVKSKTLGTAIILRGNDRYEYTTFRKDYYPNNGQHTPESVDFIDSIEEDAKRRDFTCNAIYYDIKNDKLIDFYDGITDIKKRILRAIETPDEVFCHDGVRILSLFRFQCELNFKIERETLESAFKFKENLRDVSGEKLVYEITRILHSPNKYKGIAKTHAYMSALRYFNRGGLWLIFGIDRPKLKFKMVKRVSHKSQGFLIDLIDNINPISVSYYLNLILSDSFGLTKKMADNYINILSGYYEALNKQQNKPYFFRYFDNFPQIYLLLIHKSKYLANKYQFFYKYIISHRLIMSTKELKINGDDIKEHYPTVKANRYNGILESLLSDVFDGKLSNEKEELISAVESKLKYL